MLRTLPWSSPETSWLDPLERCGRREIYRGEDGKVWLIGSTSKTGIGSGLNGTGGEKQGLPKVCIWSVAVAVKVVCGAGEEKASGELVDAGEREFAQAWSSYSLVFWSRFMKGFDDDDDEGRERSFGT